MSQHMHTLLCLGDSYTVAEGLPLYESFPYQLVQQLRRAGMEVNAPEVVAKTGWTSSELASHLLHYHFRRGHYDYVTLLIGVNNQYRGLSIEDFETDFSFLLQKAIFLAGGRPERVGVLSIPDWGVTPFAHDRNRAEIAREIDTFNHVCETQANKQGAAFFSITSLTRAAADNEALLAGDGLHLSALVYAQWADMLCSWVMKGD